jgi:hypothetical protein
LTTRRARLAGLVAVALAAATGLVGLSTSTATAAVCSTAGTSAVVDAKGAGGGTRAFCDPVSGSKSASAVFQDVKVSVRRNPDGSVCQVDGLPEGAPCGGLGTQYWGLFWSNGRGGTWTYSQQGDTSLTIPKNGSVAWAWQSGSGERKPGVAPPVVNATPTPTPTKTPTPKPKPTKTPKPTRTPKTPKPTKAGTAAASAAPTGATATTAAAPLASASVSTTPSASAVVSPSESASESAAPSETLEPTPDVTGTQKVDTAFTPKEDHAGLPAWIPVSVILALALLAFGGLWWRNRSSP